MQNSEMALALGVFFSSVEGGALVWLMAIDSEADVAEADLGGCCM